ncbi:MAG TPA: DUF6460 domain-containing protein [Micropepsaceae bacterium]|nr:DUF6460 domain-containing protein [Micropepsaceae bacterium]HRK70845.1 DUF6460 domain-containing protein [Micropepsaceae bacterium]
MSDVSPRRIKDTVFSLLMASFVVGILLWVFGIDPMDLWSDLGGTVERIWHAAADIAEWAGRYILLGAVIVVPLWAVWMLIGLATRSGKKTGAGE